MINRNKQEIARSIAEQLRPREKLDGLQYTEKFGYITNNLSRGKWKTRPYQERWFTWFTDPVVEVMWCMKSSRVGWTMAGKVGFFQYHIEYKQSQMMLLMPTDTEIKKFSKEFVDSHFHPETGAPACKGLLSTKQSKTGESNTYWYKIFKNGSIFEMASAATPRFGRMVERDRLWVEEPSAFGAIKEGDIIKILMKRAATSPDPKLLAGGTPVQEFDYTHQGFLKGDQQHRYYPFPCCGEYQELTLEKLILSGEDFGRMKCEFCEATIENECLEAMDRHAGWACPLQVPGGREGQVLKNGLPVWESQYCWAAMSYHPGAAWPLIAQEYNEALVELRRGNPDPMLAFKNTTEGVPWRDAEAIKISAEGLAKRRNDTSTGNGYPIDTVPNGVVLVTIGVDVQGGDDTLNQGLHIHVWGWGAGEERWHLAFHFVDCDPAIDGEIGRILDPFAEATWRREDGAELTMALGAIDDGGRATEEVRRFCSTRVGRWVPVKGGGTELLSPGRPVAFTAKNKRAGRPGRDVLLYSVGYEASVGLWKRRLGIEQPGPGYVHLGDAATEQVLAELFPWRRERKTNKGRGPSGVAVYEWAKPGGGAHDEAGDCARYAYAAMQLVALRSNRLTFWRDLERRALATIPKEEEAQRETARRTAVALQKRPGGFVTNW
jgi:phage terminase large subunit GpA-like protein